MSSLVMDNHWDPRILEFCAVNVTGFRWIDPQSEFVQHFNRQWNKRAMEEAKED